MASRGARIVRALLACGLVAAVGTPLVVTTVRDRRARNAELARFRALADQLAPLARRSGTNRRIFINGQPTFFGLRTASGSVSATLASVRDECAKGDLGVRLERPGEGAPPAATLLFAREDRQVSADVGASLCVFRDPSSDAVPRSGPIRYTLAHKIDGDKTSVFTVATESGAPFETLFPAEGDVPGGDLEGVPRPRGSRRTFVATIEGELYSVRIYDIPGALTSAVRTYDEQMAAAGWTRSAAVAAAMPDVRSYALGTAEIVASFEDHDGTTVVSIAPIEGPAASK